MSAERDAGLQAMRQGNFSAAEPLLETACQQDPGDIDAHLFLGAAYGQVGKPMEAISAITRAVQLQPANAQARYNLAVAMEQGGYREQAITALGQALTLQPDYPKAREALQRLEGGAVALPDAAPATVYHFQRERIRFRPVLRRSAKAPASWRRPCFGSAGPCPGESRWAAPQTRRFTGSRDW